MLCPGASRPLLGQPSCGDTCTRSTASGRPGPVLTGRQHSGTGTRRQLTPGCRPAEVGWYHVTKAPRRPRRALPLTGIPKAPRGTRRPYQAGRSKGSEGPSQRLGADLRARCSPLRRPALGRLGVLGETCLPWGHLWGAGETSLPWGAWWGAGGDQPSFFGSPQAAEFLGSPCVTQDRSGGRRAPDSLKTRADPRAACWGLRGPGVSGVGLS